MRCNVETVPSGMCAHIKISLIKSFTGRAFWIAKEAKISHAENGDRSVYTDAQADLSSLGRYVSSRCGTNAPLKHDSCDMMDAFICFIYSIARKVQTSLVPNQE